MEETARRNLEGHGNVCPANGDLLKYGSTVGIMSSISGALHMHQVLF